MIEIRTYIRSNLVSPSNSTHNNDLHVKFLRTLLVGRFSLDFDQPVIAELVEHGVTHNSFIGIKDSDRAHLIPGIDITLNHETLKDRRHEAIFLL